MSYHTILQIENPNPWILIPQINMNNTHDTIFTYTYTVDIPEEEVSNDMEGSVLAVERILNYRFRNRGLLVEALTHSSCVESAVNYERLEYVGDAALGLAITNLLFLEYPDRDPGQLSLMRAANISTEKLARVAIRSGLHKYVRHNAPALDQKVREFALIVEQEEETVYYGGPMKAPKVLADIVESVAAALYVDCEFDLKHLWLKFRALLEPIVTLDKVQQEPQPVTMLFELCQKDGKQVDFKHWRNGEKSIASVHVDGKFIASSSSEQKENAKLHAAKAALAKLSHSEIDDRMDSSSFSEIDGAKQNLNELCGKKKWPKPSYSIESDVGAAHERRFICSCQFEIADAIVKVLGDEKLRVKDAEKSAAAIMLSCLREHNYI